MRQLDQKLTTFAMRCRVRRLELGLSQGALGKRIGVRDSAITHYETARRQPPLDKLAALADALGCGLDWLTGRTDAGDDGPDGERKLVAAYRRLAPDRGPLLLAIAATMAGEGK